MSVVLVNPPLAKPCEPPPGLLTLAGHLAGRGAEVVFLDGNLKTHERLLESANLERAVRQLEERGTGGRRLTSARRAARRAPEAFQALRRPGTYGEPGVYRDALHLLAEGYRAISTARGARVGVGDLEEPGLSPLSSEDLCSAYRNPPRLALAPELQEIARSILALDPQLVGVSATFLSQALPAFALAGFLRQTGYQGTLVLGGGLIGSWAPRLRPDSKLFTAWDALVAGPGERALEEAARRAQVPDAPGVLAPGLGLWNPPDPSPPCPPAHTSGVPWGRYLAPGPILPAASSRGCYWRRCSFCPETAQSRLFHWTGRAGDLSHQLLQARQQSDIRWLHLTDEAVPPRTLRALARDLRGHGPGWYGFARPEPVFLDPRVAEELAAGGCAMLQLGIESTSQRLLDLLGKGTRACHFSAILRNLARAGIRTYVYLLFGLPSETEEEASRTLEWAGENSGAISFLNLALLNLPRGSALEAAPERYGVRNLQDPSDLDLSLYRGFEDAGNWTREQARRLLSDARSRAPLREILARTPPGFTSNHAAFCPLNEGRG